MRTRPFRAAIAAVAAAVLFVPTPPPALRAQAAAGVDAALLAGLRWRSVGPARGGRSIAVAGSNSRRNEYYFGATGGGLWKTADGGLTWRAGLGRLLQDIVGRRCRRLRIPTRRRLRRHGRSPAARQRHPGRRCLQVGRRRAHLDARRPRTHDGRQPHPRPSHQPRHRLRRRARRSRTGQTPSGASSSRSTAARRGAACWRATTRLARPICRWTRRTPTCCTPDFGKSSARRTHSRAVARAAGCSRRPTAARPGPS